VGEEERANSSSLHHAERQACGAAACEALSVIKAPYELAFLCSAFPLKGPVVSGGGNKAALSVQGSSWRMVMMHECE
jgi:hypothetical protein